MRPSLVIAHLLAVAALTAARRDPLWVVGLPLTSAAMTLVLPRARWAPILALGAATVAHHAIDPQPYASPIWALGIVGLWSLCGLATLLPHARTVTAARVVSYTLLFVLLNLAYLMAGEKLFRHIELGDLYEVRAVDGSAANDLYIRGEELKWTHAPGFIGVFTHPEFEGESFRTNHDGFRDREWPTEPVAGEQRALLLGDSIGVGFGVEMEATYASLLAERLAEETGARVRSMNAAVAGYGPGEQLLTARGLIERYTPHVVVALFYDGNDLEDLCLQLELDGKPGRPPADGSVPPDGEPWLAAPGADARGPGLLSWRYWTRYSHLARFIDRHAGALFSTGEPDAHLSARVVRAARHGADDVELMEEIDLAVSCYTSLDDECTRAGARLLVARVPMRSQTSARQWDRHLEELGLEPADYRRERLGELVLERCAARGIATVDLLPVLRVEPPETTRRHYFAEGHLNRTGHARIAEALTERLRSWFDP